VLEVLLFENGLHLIGGSAQLDEVSELSEFLGVRAAAGGLFDHAFVACQIDCDHQHQRARHDPEQDKEEVLVFKHGRSLVSCFHAAIRILPRSPRGVKTWREPQLLGTAPLGVLRRIGGLTHPSAPIGY